MFFKYCSGGGVDIDAMQAFCILKLCGGGENVCDLINNKDKALKSLEMYYEALKPFKTLPCGDTPSVQLC